MKRKVYPLEKVRNRILIGDALAVLRKIPRGVVSCCVTSPPYFGLRDYGVEGQLGLEKTPEEYVAKMVDVFREVRRVLRDDGTLWLNLGDGYARSGGAVVAPGSTARAGNTLANVDTRDKARAVDIGLKPKDLVGIPWRVAFALQADGWYLRADIIWHKPNPMPESVTDRPTKSHEYVFLLAKSERYYYDAKAIAEKSVTKDPRRPYGSPGAWEMDGRPESQKHGGENRFNVKRGGFNGKTNDLPGREAFRKFTEMRNRRDVWTVVPKRFKGAHFATFPETLVEPCILAGCPVGGIVLDPFIGSGTSGAVAQRLGRNYIGIELNPGYAKMAEGRIVAVEGKK